MSGRGLGRGRLFRDKRGKYVAEWSGADRRVRRKILSTDRRVAEKMLAAIIRERDLVDIGIGVEGGQERMLADVVARYLEDLAASRRPATVERARRDLAALQLAFGAGVRVRDLTPDLVSERRRKRVADGASKRTANMEAATLKACLGFAERSRLIGVNPIARLRPLPVGEEDRRKRRRALSEIEFSRFLRAALDEDADRAAHVAAARTIGNGTKGASYADRDRRPPVPQAPFFSVVATCGLRYGEAAALRWSDFGRLPGGAGVLTVRAENAKGRRTREVPVPAYLASELQDLRRAEEAAIGRPVGDSEPLFLSTRGNPLERSGDVARHHLRRLLTRAEIPFLDERGRSIDVHALRGSAATRLLRHGVALPIVAEVLGHKNIQVTMAFYMDLRVAETSAAVAKVPDAKPSASLPGSVAGPRRWVVREPKPRSIPGVDARGEVAIGNVGSQVTIG